MLVLNLASFEQGGVELDFKIVTGLRLKSFCNVDSMWEKHVVALKDGFAIEFDVSKSI